MKSSLFVAGTVVAIVLAAAAGTAGAASLPALWPTFSQPTTIVTVDLRGLSSNPDLLAQTTLMGAYNQLQGPTRLFLIDANDEAYWLSQLVHGIAVQPLPYSPSQANGALSAMLSSYGSAIRGAIIYDSSNPESVNVATTMAGTDDAMVITASELSLVQSYKVPILADLRSQVWIGSDTNLVNNSTVNPVVMLIGGSNGWYMAYGGQSATLTSSGSGLQWQIQGSLGHNDWVAENVSLQAGKTYTFSAQVAGSGQIYLDAWDGTKDNASPPVTLSSAYQTLQLIVTIPAGAPAPQQIQIRTTGVNAANVTFKNAAVISARVADEQWAYENLISSTNKQILGMLNVNIVNLRDYLVASKTFVFDLSSDNADESALMTRIINHTPHNTPIMGYIDDEGKDVPFLSGPNLGHFLNASDFFSDESVWASLKGPSSLTQSVPSAVEAQAGTVYVAFAVSDGDNAQYVEHHEKNLWTGSQFLGAVPAAWTMPPAMIQFAPTMLAHYYQAVPQSNELMAGPSGVGYATAETGSDLSQLGVLTGEAMQQTGMSTVTLWDTSSGNVAAFAQATGMPHVVYQDAFNYALTGNTVIDGQQIGYRGSVADEVSSIESYVSSSWSSSSPLFIEALINAWGLSPDDLLLIAQRLQASGHNYVFLTPSELALTEKAYHNAQTGLPLTNTQARSGATITQAFPNNLVWDSTGLDGLPAGSWSVAYSGQNATTLHAATYQYGPALRLQVPANLGHDEWASTSPMVQSGQSYVFSVDVAGSGQVFLDVWDGSTDHVSPTVTLTSNFQTFKETVTMQSSAGQLQVRVPNQPTATNVYFRNASVVPTGGRLLFGTGAENGDSQPAWTGTVDSGAPPAGSSSNVGGICCGLSGPELSAGANSQTHAGGYSLLYSGKANGGTTTYAYMKVFDLSSQSLTLDANSRLSYWIYPQSPYGAEPQADLVVGTNSTCVAIDMIFTDGTNLRDSGVKDQYGNPLHPEHQCGHLQLDQWNYITVSLGALSGKKIDRIDIGYDQPGSSGGYRGFIDDISISN